MTEKQQCKVGQKCLTWVFILCFAAGGSKAKKHYAKRDTVSSINILYFLTKDEKLVLSPSSLIFMSVSA